MGWSCSKEASEVLSRWSKRCIASTGSSNTWESAHGRFFFESSITEHDDGAVTGSIWKMVDENHCRNVGAFRINGDGSIARGPSFLGG